MLSARVIRKYDPLPHRGNQRPHCIDAPRATQPLRATLVHSQTAHHAGTRRAINDISRTTPRAPDGPESGQSTCPSNERSTAHRGHRAPRDALTRTEAPRGEIARPDPTSNAAAALADRQRSAASMHARSPFRVGAFWAAIAANVHARSPFRAGSFRATTTGSSGNRLLSAAEARRLGPRRASRDCRSSPIGSRHAHAVLLGGPRDCREGDAEQRVICAGARSSRRSVPCGAAREDSPLGGRCWVWNLNNESRSPPRC